jgi:catechol 2,3-dioxygenase-like lactoylglutathione lyase family enzyme
MQSQLTLGPIGQIARAVDDLERAQAWFKDVLGLPHLYTYGKLAFFDCGGTRLMLEDRSILTRHMIAKHPDGTEEWMAFFRDSEGAMLAIMSQVLPLV